MVIKMNINKLHYKILSEPKKVYLEMSTLEIRQMLNMSFKNPTAENDLTGIFGKYNNLEKMYKIKYIYTRNKQLQPMTFERYQYLLDVGEDGKGAYIEYAMFYDKLYDPIIRFVYILAVCAVLAYLFYAYKIGAMNIFSAGVLGALISSTIALVFKKHKESREECEKTEQLFLKLIGNE